MPTDIRIRNTTPADQPRVIGVMNAWWDGRDLSPMLPRLFFVHFCDTSFVMEREEELVAFLVGFLSQGRADEGYIHFMGVHPDFRYRGLGRLLYERFFHLCAEHGRRVVRSCTSPVNRGSIRFHRKLGFAIETGDAMVDGIPVTLDYNRPGDPKVLFRKTLS